MIYNEDDGRGLSSRLWVRFLEWSDKTTAGMIEELLK